MGGSQSSSDDGVEKANVIEWWPMSSGELVPSDRKGDILHAANKLRCIGNSCSTGAARSIAAVVHRGLAEEREAESARVAAIGTSAWSPPLPDSPPPV